MSLANGTPDVFFGEEVTMSCPSNRVVQPGVPQPALAVAAPTACTANNQRNTPCPRSELRQSLRFRTRLQRGCRLIRARGEGPWFASVRNISATGIGLVCKDFFKPRMFLTVEFPTRSGSYGPPKLFCIKHVTQLPGTRFWSLGGVFASRLSDEEVRALLA